LAGVALSLQAAEDPRFTAMAQLEKAVLNALPPGMLRPADLAAAASKQLHRASAILGSVEINGITELSPCWRPILMALTEHVEVIWAAGPRATPEWLSDTGVIVTRTEPKTPEVKVVSAASAYHEAIEAMRWMRALLASGTVDPADIAIAAATTAPYDDYFLALRDDSQLPLAFNHGVKITATRDGQAAGALADMLIRGISQTRMRRLAALSDAEVFKTLPQGWMRVLPQDAPLTSLKAWSHLFARLTDAEWPDGIDHTPTLRKIVELLAQGPGAAEEVGSTLLGKRACEIWRKALRTGPAEAIDMTLDTLNQPDKLEACVSAVWMSASALAASPRRYVRLIGLTAGSWPRPKSEDRLLPNHVVPTHELNPLPVWDADRRDFETILKTAEAEVVLCSARRDSQGRRRAQSPLITGRGAEIYLPRHAVPLHAFSEADRLMARSEEFSDDPEVQTVFTCWQDWRQKDITAHDGLVRADHPLLKAILARPQSASSLRLLLRNPLGFVWRYGLGWRMPKSGSEPLVLDALSFGDLVHRTLDSALKSLEGAGGLAGTNDAQVRTRVHAAIETEAAIWESEQPVPPPTIWKMTLAEVEELAVRALTYDGTGAPGSKAFGEVAFGGAAPNSETELPWDPSHPVEIPGTGITIRGSIDRLDLASGGSAALIRDYKTGKAPKDKIIIDGGKELQRCLYGFAVKALLGDQVSIRASLLYLREDHNLELEDPDGTLAQLTEYLSVATENLTAGHAIFGDDAGNKFDDLAFALPAMARASYCVRKHSAANERLGRAVEIWEAP